ncbi:MAG TPA: restriction endonuclease subunit S [Methylobacter sp.]|jgi:type I restriction enzyme S subunit
MLWVCEPLGEICRKGRGRIQTGPFGSQLHESDYSSDGTPVVMPADIADGKVAVTRIARIAESHVERLKRHKLVKGDIVYGRRGDIGRQALVRDENVGWLCGTGCLKITLGNGPLSCEFLHRYLSTNAVISWIEGQAVGATMPNLNTGILERVPVFYPKDRATQKKIAAVLSAYDELIDNNRRRIALLEKMAEEIYREWFVRLRFPGHEKIKKVKGVPEGWEIKKLGSVLELCYGKALKDDDRVPGEFLVYGSSGVVGTHNEALVKTPSLIVGRKGNVGSVYWPDRGFFPIDTVYFVKSELPNSFLYFLLRLMNFINNDSAVPGLNRNQAYSNLFFLPPVPLINKYAEVADSQFEMKQYLTRQNENLIVARDRLLPRLISGKLSVENLDIQFPPGMEEVDHAV